MVNCNQKTVWKEIVKNKIALQSAVLKSGVEQINFRC